MQIIRNDGQRATVTQRISRTGSPDQLVLTFDDGTCLIIVEDILIQREDGMYLLPVDPALLSELKSTSSDTEERIVVPVIEEELQVTKRQVERTIVRATIRVDSHEEIVEEPLLYEWVSVERVPVNKLIEGNLPDVQEKNGVLVIPIIEEVLVIEKKILLKEEIHLSKRQATVRKPQRIVLRSQMVEVERIPIDSVPPETADRPST